MTPKSAQQQIVAELEAESGYPVVVQEVPSLPVLATAKAATQRTPFSLIRVRDDIGPTSEYTVAYQCGFLLRQAQLLPAERWDLTAPPSARVELSNLVREKAIQPLDQPTVAAFAEQLLGGLMTQLRSAPLGLRIDSWLSSAYPVFDKQQRTSVGRQLQEAAAVLSPSVKAMAPGKVYAASVAMNAAVAVYWAHQWQDRTVAAPYKVSGYLDKAETLLKLFKETPESPAGDRTLINAWAAEVGISDWCAFVTREE